MSFTDYKDFVRAIHNEHGQREQQVHRCTKIIVEQLVQEDDDARLGQWVRELHEQSKRFVPRFEKKGWVKFVEINQEGNDGPEYWMEEKTCVVGSKEGWSFPEDDFLSPAHARFTWANGQLTVQDIASLNGTFVRIVAPHLLTHNDTFLMGREVLRFIDLVQNAEDEKLMEKDEHGVKRMGSPAFDESCAVAVLGVGDAVYDMHKLEQDVVRIGRDPEVKDTEGRITFEADAFMSSNHARLERTEQGWVLHDTSSGNGTWIRLDEPYVAREGDLIFMGKQLVRVDWIEHAR